jgi:hypothetical protein
MAFQVTSKKSGKTYFLHSRNQTLKGGHQVIELGIKAVGIYVTWLEFRPWMAELEKFLK